MRRIEKRGAVNVLCDDDGNGCMPATRAEIEFFDEIECLRAEVEALQVKAALYRDLLLWTLYHHQGGSSVVGQTIRKALGIGQFDHLTPEQISDAERAAQGGG